MYSAVKAGRRVPSTSVSLRVIQRLALFASKPQLATDLSDPKLRAKWPTVGEGAVWSCCAPTVAVHQCCVLFPATSPRSLTGCRPGWAAGGNSIPGCCLWPHNNCHPIWDPEPACVNLSPTGAGEQHSESGTRAFTPTQQLPPHPGVSTAPPCMCTPAEEKATLPCCSFLISLFWPNGRRGFTCVRCLWTQWSR